MAGFIQLSDDTKANIHSATVQIYNTLRERYSDLFFTIQTSIHEEEIEIIFTFCKAKIPSVFTDNYSHTSFRKRYPHYAFTESNLPNLIDNYINRFDEIVTDYITE